MQRRRTRMGGMMAAVLVLFAGLGCQVEEALVDGFYGGISDTVATVIADLLLDAVQPNP